MCNFNCQYLCVVICTQVTTWFSLLTDNGECEYRGEIGTVSASTHLYKIVTRNIYVLPNIIKKCYRNIHSPKIVYRAVN